MDKLDKFCLVISGMTCDGVVLDQLEKYEFDATKKYLEMQGHQVKFIKWRTEEDRKKVFFKKSSNLDFP